MLLGSIRKGFGPEHRRGGASGVLEHLGLRWCWEWLEHGPRSGEVYSRITQPVACCPGCHRELRVAPSHSRAVRRPVWPAIYSCACGFLRGFPLAPEELVFQAYREINRLHAGRVRHRGSAG